jgi:hypothetical protein
MSFLAYVVTFLLAFVLGLALGMVVYKFKLFPYHIMQKLSLKDEFKNMFEGVYAIGLYEGNSLLEMKEASNITNPVLRAACATDIVAGFVADPFVIKRDGVYYMFFEILNRETRKGEIAYATSQDLNSWTYGKVVLREEFHISYPHVFDWNGFYYMTPESFEDLSVRLYIAESFPERFRYVKSIITGYRFVDPTIFRWKGKWWMFVGTLECDTLNLYFSDSLEGLWIPHPKNPIIKKDKRFARPAGRVIVYDGKLVRFAQDCSDGYGRRVYAFWITELSEVTYSEVLLKEEPIVGGTGRGWNAVGMHHVELLDIGERLLMITDGRRR